MPSDRVEPGIVRPYDENDLPSYEQISATIAPTRVATDELWPTQPMLDMGRLLAIQRGQPCEGPDPYPHVVRHHGRLWVHNGHHRWIVALLRDDPTIMVRIIHL